MRRTAIRLVIAAAISIHGAQSVALADEKHQSDGACANSGATCSHISASLEDDCLENPTTGLYDCTLRWSGALIGWGLLQGSTETTACTGFGEAGTEPTCHFHMLRCTWLPATPCGDPFEFSSTSALTPETCYDVTVEGVLRARITPLPAESVVHPYRLVHTFCTGP